MTIGKRSFSLTILAVLLILAAVLILPSCKSNADGESASDDALTMLLEIVESIETTAEADYYVVVIPSDATSALAQ